MSERQTKQINQIVVQKQKQSAEVNNKMLSPTFALARTGLTRPRLCLLTAHLSCKQVISRLLTSLLAVCFTFHRARTLWVDRIK